MARAFVLLFPVSCSRSASEGRNKVSNTDAASEKNIPDTRKTS
jgi:hypothetical protein